MYHISIIYRNPVNNKDHSLVSVGSPDHLILSTEHMLNAVNNVNTSDAHHHVISTTAGMNNHYANNRIMPFNNSNYFLAYFTNKR